MDSLNFTESLRGRPERVGGRAGMADESGVGGLGNGVIFGGGGDGGDGRAGGGSIEGVSWRSRAYSSS